MPARPTSTTQSQHDGARAVRRPAARPPAPGQGVRRPVHPRAHERGQREQTYEEISGEYIGLSDADKASADGQALGQLRQTLFMGNTLRGLLLYGYAFATMRRHRALRRDRLVRRRAGPARPVGAGDAALPPRRRPPAPAVHAAAGGPGRGVTRGSTPADADGRVGERSPTRPSSPVPGAGVGGAGQNGRTSSADAVPGDPGQHDASPRRRPCRPSRLRSCSGTTSTPRFLIVRRPMPRSRSAARSGFSR